MYSKVQGSEMGKLNQDFDNSLRLQIRIFKPVYTFYRMKLYLPLSVEMVAIETDLCLPLSTFPYELWVLWTFRANFALKTRPCRDEKIQGLGHSSGQQLFIVTRSYRPCMVWPTFSSCVELWSFFALYLNLLLKTNQKGLKYVFFARLHLRSLDRLENRNKNYIVKPINLSNVGVYMD